MNSTLSQVSVGSAAVVRRVKGTSQIRRRLLDMGIVPGVSVEMTRISPLGDPIEVRVRGYRLSLRKSEADGIEVEPVDG